RVVRNRQAVDPATDDQHVECVAGQAVEVSDHRRHPIAITRLLLPASYQLSAFSVKRAPWLLADSGKLMAKRGRWMGWGGATTAEVREYWDRHIHDLEITRHPVGSRGF